MRSWLHSHMRRRWPASISMLVAVLVVALVGVWAGVAVGVDPEPHPFMNPGFEEGQSYWSFSAQSPSPLAPVVVGAESASGVPVGPVDEQMLRLGLPKGTDSNQIKGVIWAKQTFKHDGGDIRLVYRIFTWEHRSGDTFVIDVKDGAGNSVGKIAGAAGPYSAPIPPLTKPNKLAYDPDWIEVTITELGAYKDTFLTLSYTLSNPKNASHDTWVYVDHVNEPPVAVLNWAPDESVEPPHEGDVVGLYGDESFDPDGSIVKWEWEITNVTNPADYPVRYYGPVGFIVPPNGEHKYAVKLTVWDDEGASDEADVEFRVQNAAPHVNILNVIEMPKGTEGQLMGRFVDPGWEDEHDATWTWTWSDSNPDELQPVSGTEGSAAGEVQEDHLAPASSGQVLGTFTATDMSGIWDLTLSVEDPEDESVVTDPDPSQVHVVEYPSNHLEPGDLSDDPDVFPLSHELWSDGAYLSYIQSQGDVDIFEVKLPDGDLIPMGTEVLVTLRGSSGDYDLPADYDLVVFEGVEGDAVEASEEPQAAPFMKSQFQPAAFMHSGFMHSAFMNSGFMHSAFMNSGFMHSPFRETGFMNSGFMNSGFMNSAFMHSPFAESAFMNSGFMNSAFMHSAFMHSDYASTGFMHSPMDGYPLSAMSFTGTEHNNTSGTDVSFDELGFDLGALPQGAVHDLRVLGFSANSGTEQEVVLATAGYPQTGGGIHGHVYVAVKSSTGAYSASSPYTLQIETSVLADTFAFTSEDQQSPLVGSTNWDEWPTSVSDSDADSPLTLFVTQLDRLKSLYTPDATAADPLNGGNIVLDALESIDSSSVDGLVEGKVVNLPANIYDDWDREPWRVDLANEVAQEIRSVIQDELSENSDIEYVVLVGNDRIIPFRRLIDQTIIGNEQNYADQSFLRHFRYEEGQLVPRPSATLASIANGYILTDDYYGDAEPISWGGSYLYIPDVSVSRLVETPGEIADTIAAFIDEEGTLSPSVGLVTGYDFMKDGADNVSRILTEAGLPEPTELIGESWSGDALRTELLADDGAANINAHFTHFAGLSPIGYAASLDGTLDDEGELLLSSDIADGSAGSFLGRLVFSMGCHAGLNVPDEQVVEVSPESPIAPKLDFPQAMMQQGGVYLGSTGFGYGDTVGIAGTEALIGFFAEQLVGGADQTALPPAASVGLALAQAKQGYLGSLTSLTPYDQKSSVQFTLYGMPQYHLPGPGGGSVVQKASASSVLVATGGDSNTEIIELPSPFQLSLSESSMDDGPDVPPSPLPSHLYTLRQHIENPNEYISADYKAEAIADRPIHPVAPVDLPLDPEDPEDELYRGPVHGFVYTGGSYYNLDQTFHPAIARAATEWDVDATEFQVATSEFWPVEPGSLTTRETGDGGYDQTFIAVPAQFKPEPGTDPIEGIERVWSSLAAELLRSTEPDWAAPIVRDLDLWMANGQLVVSLDAHDASGISRIVALQLGANEMYVPIGGDQYFGGQPNGDEGRYELIMDLTGIDPRDISLLVQVVDGCGNVTRLTGKGATISLKPGLRNPGFEEGLKYWDVTEPVVDNAAAVQADNYASPFAPSWMLRLGLPDDDGNAHQVKGVTSVSQQFISEGEEIVVAYLLKTVDGRDFDDEFVISVTDAEGKTVLEPPFSITNAQVTNTWEVMPPITLEEGVYTLTYTLYNTNSAAKNSWIYIDQGD